MARLYLDNDVSHRYIEYFLNDGHRVVTTRDARLYRAPDGDQFLFAHQNGLTIITHNENDYVLLHRAWMRWFEVFGLPDAHPGIVILRQHMPIEPQVLATSELLRIQVPFVNQVWRWMRGSQRLEQVPKAAPWVT